MGFCIDRSDSTLPRVSNDTEALPSGGNLAPCPAPSASGDSKYVQGSAPNAPTAARSPSVPRFETEYYDSGVVRAESYAGTKYPKGSYVRYYANGKVAKIVFSGETDFRGIKFHCGDYVKLSYDTGKIESIATHSPVEINGNLFAPVFRNFPSKNNFLAGVALAKKMDTEETSFIEMQNGAVYKGVLEEGISHGDMYIPAGTVVSFHRNGILREANFDLPQTLLDFEVSSLSLDEKGNLSSVQLYDAALIGTKSTVFEAGNWVSFHPNGEVCGGTLAFDDMIDGIFCKGGSFVSFHPNSRLDGCTAAKNFTLSGAKCAGGDDVKINEKGQLELCTLSENQTFRTSGMKKKLVFLPGEFTSFSSPGVVSRGHILSGQRVYGIKFGETPSSQVEINDMRVSGVLGEDATIDGVRLEKGDWVRVSQDGKLIEIIVIRDKRVRGVLLKADEYYQFYDSRKPTPIEMP